MDTHSIIAELEAERDRLEQAIQALRDGAGARQHGRKATSGRRRGMSAEARHKISEAQKRRWAKARKAS